MLALEAGLGEQLQLRIALLNSSAEVAALSTQLHGKSWLAHVGRSDIFHMTGALDIHRPSLTVPLDVPCP